MVNDLTQKHGSKISKRSIFNHHEPQANAIPYTRLMKSTLFHDCALSEELVKTWLQSVGQMYQNVICSMKKFSYAIYLTGTKQLSVRIHECKTLLLE